MWQMRMLRTLSPWFRVQELRFRQAGPVGEALELSCGDIKLNPYSPTV